MSRLHRLRGTGGSGDENGTSSNCSTAPVQLNLLGNLTEVYTATGRDQIRRDPLVLSCYRDQPKAGTGQKMLSVPSVFSTSRFQVPVFCCDKIVVIVTLLAQMYPPF